MNSFNNKLSSRSGFFKRALAMPAILFFLLAGVVASAQAQSSSENFDNITLLPARGWVMQNNSSPVGTTNWFQGNPNIFPSHAGAVNSYIAADFHNASGTGTISNWLLTPTMSFSTSAFMTFRTRSVSSPFPDRLEVRLSTNGASTNVGTGVNDVGDFTTRLLVINENLEDGGYPSVWTQFKVFVPSALGTGRLAFRYFVTNAGPNGDNSDYIGIDTFSYDTGDPPENNEAPLDYNGDNKTDYVVVRGYNAASGTPMTWFINNGTTSTQTQWGISPDTPVSGDFDGDDKHDITVYRPRSAPNSFFYALRSSNATIQARELGATGDDPTVVGDYDGDDIDDFAVYRGGASAGQPSFWYYRGSATVNGGITFVQYGQNGDFPAPGDYDGDGKNDLCVQRNNGSGQGVFLLRQSSNGTFRAVLWGTSSDLILPGDYDGDGKDDFAVARGSGGQIIWSVLGQNANNIIHYGQPWGLSASDFPAQGDYDGDGKIDIAVWRPNADVQQNFFYIRRSSNNTLLAFEWGQQGDYPVANYNSH